MFIKPGVRLDNLTPQMVLAALIVREVFRAYMLEATITSGSEGTHKSGSLHSQGNALDFRTHALTPLKIESLAAQIRDRLGNLYDVVIEPNHLHVEYDPPGP